MDSDKENDKTHKHLVSTSIHCEKTAYYNDHINNHLHNTKKLWLNLKSTVLLDFGSTRDVPRGHVDMNDPYKFIDHILNVPVSQNESLSDLTYYEYHRHSHASFHFKQVHENEIDKIILNINPKLLELII